MKQYLIAALVSFLRDFGGQRQVRQDRNREGKRQCEKRVRRRAKIPVFLVVRFVPRTGSGLGSILSSTELPVAVASSALILGDHVGPLQAVGVALVLVGIALPNLPRRAQEPVPAG